MPRKDEPNSVDRFYAAVGEKLRTVRLGEGVRKMSQTELGKVVGLTRTSIANIEGGRQRVLVHTLVALAEALAVKPSELIPGSTSPEPIPEILDGRERRFVEKIVTQVNHDTSKTN